MRLFISIDLLENMCCELHEQAPVLEGWKKTPENQIHLTLFFIGNCTEEEKVKLAGRLGEISFQPFTLKTDGFGVFPNRKNPRILWSGIQNSEPLLTLQKRVEEIASPFRKKPEKKKFKPHLTLSRRKSGFGRVKTIDHLLRKQNFAMEFFVNRFLLKQSVLKPEGSEHITLNEFQATYT
jgi:RNA 2',3'-cyclic 3'-phosphodiesterase